MVNNNYTQITHICIYRQIYVTRENLSETVNYTQTYKIH